MPQNKGKKEIKSLKTKQENDSDVLEDLSSKMRDLFSSNCIKILKIIIDKPSAKFFDATKITSILKEEFDITISKQATRVHLEDLVGLDILVRKKTAGINSIQPILMILFIPKRSVM